MPKAVEIRRGQAIMHENQLWVVHEAQHVAKGNKGSYMKLKLKNFKQGNVVEYRFNVNDKVETPFVEDKPYEFLYRDGDDYVLMENVNYEQVNVNKDLIPDGEKFLKGNEQLQCKIMDGRIIGADLPNTVELEVTDAPPVIKGATATNQNKESTLETGYNLRVPPFISKGELHRVDTRTGAGIERA